MILLQWEWTPNFIWFCITLPDTGFVTRQPAGKSDGPQVHSHVLGIVNGLITAHSIRLGEQFPLKGIIGHLVSTRYGHEVHMENVYMLVCYYVILQLPLRKYSLSRS